MPWKERPTKPKARQKKTVAKASRQNNVVRSIDTTKKPATKNQYSKGRNSKNEIEISFNDFVGKMTRKRNFYGYYHLTNWSTLCKMLNGAISPADGQRHRMLHLGAAANMNDEDDSKCGKNVYFASFSFGPSENISMWNGYGIPTPEAVRIWFHRNSIIAWEKRFNEGKIHVYGVNSENNLEILDCSVKLELVQVAYWSKTMKKKRAKEDPDEGLFIHDRDKYRITDKKNVIQRMRGKPYMFKEVGWSYENETRIVLVFDKDLSDTYRRVAVDFDGPLDILCKKFTSHVTQGPWYDEESKLVQDEASGNSLKEAIPSRYKGKVNMRSNCDFCSKEDKSKCECPFAKREEKETDKNTPKNTKGV